MDALLIRDSRGAGVAALRKALARQLGTDARDYPGLATGTVFDAATEAALRRWQSGIGIVADGVVGPYGQSLLGLREEAVMEVPCDLATVRPLFPATKPANVARFLPYVVNALAAAALADGPMLLAALATIRAESEGFVPIAELPSQFNTLPGRAAFSAYEPGSGVARVLGNTEPGDGARFRGRGFVQLTGRDNYRRYGDQLGIDLLANPDLANAAEVAALLLALFLADKAPAMRVALAKGDYKAARKLVNGGSHGLERFQSVFDLAAVQPAPPRATPPRKRAGATRKKLVVAARAVAAVRSLTVRKDPTDLRDRAYLPSPVSLKRCFPANAEIAHFLPRYAKAGLVLDQGSEGACTGFGLACVINMLRWRDAGAPATLAGVSPAMLYNFARRYDEYAGESYEGSSCRGALKGWFNHGVCLDDDWRAGPGTRPSYGYAQRAAMNTLGVYQRVDLGSITDLQAAIQQTTAVYVSAFTHGGWQRLKARKSAPRGHADLPLIEFDGRPSQTDGHAFALIGFNERGFVVQNSWGPDWGCGGFAVLSYADWLANAMDAWVATIGVPGVVVGRIGSASVGGRAASAAGPSSLWWSEDQAYRHSVVFGNDGRIHRYLTEDELNRKLSHQVAGLPDHWFRSQARSKTKRLVIYAHGGLNSEAAAIARARAMGRHFAANDCYPLFMVWKTGVLESLGNIVSDQFRKQPARAGFGEAFTDATDLLIEKSIGRPLARPIWSEMKENAELAYGSGRGGDLLIQALKNLAATWGQDLEIHLVGHSAGSIFLGHLLSALSAHDLQPLVASIHLYAPACTVAFANRHYAPQADAMKKLCIDLLSDRVERDDSIGPYRKSLLYLVSNALEADLRTPILGLQRVFDDNDSGWDGTSSVGDTLKTWRAAVRDAGLVSARPGEARLNVLDREEVRTGIGAGGKPLVIRAAHGSFDNDIEVVERTLGRILRGPVLTPVDDLRGY